MLTKTYFTAIAFTQELLLRIGISILIALPLVLAYAPDVVPEAGYTILFSTSLAAVFLVMSIRPLADLFPGILWLRPLVILRKGMGVFSASVIIAIMAASLLTDGGAYISTFFSAAHWSLAKGAILAPLGDLSALILLVTSNSFSKRVLGKWWKRIQRLSYVYFYSGALYEYLILGQTFALIVMVVVTVLVLAAFVRNRTKKV